MAVAPAGVDAFILSVRWNSYVVTNRDPSPGKF